MTRRATAPERATLFNGALAPREALTARVALRVLFAPLALSLLLPATTWGQLSEAAAWAVEVRTRYRIVPNITYLTANNWDAKLDLYLPMEAPNPAAAAPGASTQATPAPVLMYIHGGGWVGGSKETAQLALLPYLEMGWAVVNVEYRLARVSLAPAAVEDCRCALRWVIHNGKQYNFDANRIVVSGDSAGGHLALAVGMIPLSAGLDRECPGDEELKVAAIINWYGITDVGDLLDGPNMRRYAVGWLGSLPNRDEIAKRVSPLSYVRPGLPPILTIHGDRDPTVPYEHALRLQKALDQAGVPNQLLTIPGGKHGGFTRAQYLQAFAAIREFLRKSKLLAAGP